MQSTCEVNLSDKNKSQGSSASINRTTFSWAAFEVRIVPADQIQPASINYPSLPRARHQSRCTTTFLRDPWSGLTELVSPPEVMELSALDGCDDDLILELTFRVLRHVLNDSCGSN